MTNQVIPEAAVDAAARALDPYVMGNGGAAAEKFKDATRAEARAALEAAAPHMVADLLDKLDAVHALVYDNTLAGGCVMHVIDPARIRAALGDYPWNGNQKAEDS